MPYLSVTQGKLCSCYQDQPSLSERLDCLEVDSSPCAGDMHTSCGGPKMMELRSVNRINKEGCIDGCVGIANAYCGTCPYDDALQCCLCMNTSPWLGHGVGCQAAWFTSAIVAVGTDTAPGSRSPQDRWTFECPSLGMLVGIGFPDPQATGDTDEHVQPPTFLKCNLHTSQPAFSMVSGLRDQWTAEPVTAVGEVTACPAGAVVTGLFDKSGTLQTVELLLCAPLADGMLVSDLCYNMPTKSGGQPDIKPIEPEFHNQCTLVSGEAWAVVGLIIDADESGTWIAALRCCRINTVH